MDLAIPTGNRGNARVLVDRLQVHQRHAIASDYPDLEHADLRYRGIVGLPGRLAGERISPKGSPQPEYQRLGPRWRGREACQWPRVRLGTGAGQDRPHSHKGWDLRNTNLVVALRQLAVSQSGRGQFAAGPGPLPGYPGIALAQPIRPETVPAVHPAELPSGLGATGRMDGRTSSGSNTAE